MVKTDAVVLSFALAGLAGCAKHGMTQRIDDVVLLEDGGPADETIDDTMTGPTMDEAGAMLRYRVTAVDRDAQHVTITPIAEGELQPQVGAEIGLSFDELRSLAAKRAPEAADPTASLDEGDVITVYGISKGTPRTAAEIDHIEVMSRPMP